MSSQAKGKIVKVSGPLVVAEGMRHVNMFDIVRVSEEKLIGEVIEMHGDKASIQVYEETSGLAPGAPVETTGLPLSMELGPGLIGQMFDGIGRPLKELYNQSGAFIKRGVTAPSLSRTIKWKFFPKVKVGDVVSAGDVLGLVQETSLIQHKIMVPPEHAGEVVEIFEGEFAVDEAVAHIKLGADKDGKWSTLTTHRQGEVLPLKMMQAWPVRKGRPFLSKTSPDEPLVTGQRIVDTFFPIAKGGTAAVPGPFGSGKTVIQHQLAKWAETDIVVYIGCGERGNEMTDVLHEFPELIDPKTGKSLMERTILIANTSDMPVAAREASIYTGITIAEYYRDMGYSVSIMADSTSRWAEALREMSGRLEEMPGEEGYPAYLGSRLAQFYERAGEVRCLSSQSEERKGFLTAIGAVSPPGGDMSDPVVQSTLRIVKVFWQLDSSLAYKRHFPAINWLNSYSLYQDKLDQYFDEKIHENWSVLRAKAMKLLQEEAELEEIVKLVGMDALSPSDRIKLEAARSLREDYLHQNSFDAVDTYTSLNKQMYMLQLIMQFYDKASKVAEYGAKISSITSIPVLEGIGRLKYVPEKEVKNRYEILSAQLDEQLDACIH